MNLFIRRLSDRKMLKVNRICMCEECVKRNMPEIFIDDMNGEYEDCIRVSDLFSGEYMLSDDFYKLTV